MSREELSAAYAEGRISRRVFIRRLAVLGGAVGGVMLSVDAAVAGHLDPPWQGHASTAKKSPAKKSPAKKVDD